MFVGKQADLKPPGNAWAHSWSVVSVFSFWEPLKLGLMTQHKIFIQRKSSLCVAHQE